VKFGIGPDTLENEVPLSLRFCAVTIVLTIPDLLSGAPTVTPSITVTTKTVPANVKRIAKW
jgi:hypothetical protein